MSTEIWIAGTSVVVSFCALGLTFWQACIARKHNKLSVRPFLTTNELGDLNDKFGTIIFDLENCGVGPAIIRNFVLLNKDKEICRNNAKAFDAFLKGKAKGCSNLYTGYLVPGGALSANDKHKLLSFSYLRGQDISFVHDLNLIVEYQSIYEDEVFTYDSRKDRQFTGLEVADD